MYLTACRITKWLTTSQVSLHWSPLSSPAASKQIQSGHLKWLRMNRSKKQWKSKEIAKRSYRFQMCTKKNNIRLDRTPLSLARRKARVRLINLRILGSSLFLKPGKIHSFLLKIYRKFLRRQLKTKICRQVGKGQTSLSIRLWIKMRAHSVIVLQMESLCLRIWWNVITFLLEGPGITQEER